MRSLRTLSGIQLAALIRRREVSSREAVDAHIAQIEDVNPALNAVVRRRFADARAEADRADKVLASGHDHVPPFHGVPCTVKEAFALTGMPQTAGLIANRGALATKDAVAVARLRAAGAIPLGVTNVSELCMWMESNNKVYGRTNNPYDPARTAGGSSGGEGSIIGAGGSPFGVGSDIGGSIRMPAFFNGVFGHKPSGGLVDNTGQIPLETPGIRTYLTTGPLARRAEDLAPLLRVFVGGDRDAFRADPSEVDVGKLRVVTVEGDGKTEVEPALLAAQRRAADALAARGARVETVKIDGLRDALGIWSSMLDAANGPSFASLLGQGVPIRAARELGRWAFASSPHTFPAIALALFEKLPHLAPRRSRALVEKGHALRLEIARLVGPDGVLLYPSYPTTAPLHGKPLLTLFHWTYTAIWNALEMPATQVPLGLDARGLPLGVQVVGAHGSDHLTIAVALALEKDFGGWVPPRLAGLTSPQEGRGGDTSRRG
jgi:fatty acid amide hydrolase 2